MKIIVRSIPVNYEKEISGSFNNAMSKLNVTGLLKKDGDKYFAIVG